MKKILSLLMLVALFVSCSSDDDNDPGNNGNNMIDEKIIGKWKVEYSKTINPAVYIETQEELKKLQETSLVELKLGLNYPEDAKVIEYDGNFGEPNIIPNSGMFDMNEYQIEIKKNNSIISHRANNNPTTSIFYKVEDGYIKWINTGDSPSTIFIKYKLDNNKLTMEMIKSTGITLMEYRISEYSRITE